MVISNKRIPTALQIVSLSMAKKQLKVDTDFTEDDDLIDAYSQAAQELAEHFVGYNIAEASTEIMVSGFTPFIFEEKATNVAISKIEYLAPGDDETFVELDEEKYALKKSTTVSNHYEVSFKDDLPVLNEDVLAKVKVTVAYGQEVADVPKIVSQAIKVCITQFYDKRENSTEVANNVFHRLLSPLRKF
jgi:hypothetical protein